MPKPEPESSFVPGDGSKSFRQKKLRVIFFACRRFLSKGKSKTFKAIEHCLELPGPSEHCLELSGPPEQHCLELLGPSEQCLELLGPSEQHCLALLGTSEHCLEPIEAHFVALWCKTFKNIPLGLFFSVGLSILVSNPDLLS